MAPPSGFTRIILILALRAARCAVQKCSQHFCRTTGSHPIRCYKRKNRQKAVLTFMAHPSGFTRIILILALRAALCAVQKCSQHFCRTTGSNPIRCYKRKNRQKSVYLFGAPIRIHSYHPDTRPAGSAILCAKMLPAFLSNNRF